MKTLYFYPWMTKYEALRHRQNDERSRFSDWLNYCFSVTISNGKEFRMARKFTEEELNKLDQQMLVTLFLTMQDQMELMRQSIDNLTEQIRIANSEKYGRRTEKLSEIEGQLSLFDEAEAAYRPDVSDPDLEEVLPAKTRKKRPKGKMESDFRGLPAEEFTHKVSVEEADAFFGEGNWKRWPSDVYKKLRYTPASWTVEIHSVEVVVGTDGLRQDEYLRGKHPKGLLKRSFLTPSLASAVLNGKFGNAIPFYRIENEFKNFGINISRQTMANWTMDLSERYFRCFYDRLKEELFRFEVGQADETPVLVINDGRPTPTKSWMWVHRNSEMYRDRQIVLYEYQKTRHHEFPEEFYKGYKGILVTDGLQQYHMLEGSNPGIISANCWVHARRMFVDAVKAMNKEDTDKVRMSVAYQAVQRIAAIYAIEGTLKDLSPEERLSHRQKDIAPLVEEFFAWIKAKKADCAYLPKSQTGKGVEYFLNQEKYLRVFLTNGNVPMDNSASERSIRPFTVGRKNWLFNNTIRGAQASAVIYSVVETAKANNLRPYHYLNHLLTNLPESINDDGNIDETELEKLLPWAKELPEECRKTGR